MNVQTSDISPSGETSLKKILIVDDDTFLLFLYKSLFTRDGYVVYTAKNPREAMTWLTNNNPVLVISDMNMPMTDTGHIVNDAGFQLTDNIRQTYPTIPCVIVSSDITITEKCKKKCIPFFEKDSVMTKNIDNIFAHARK